MHRFPSDELVWHDRWGQRRDPVRGRRFRLWVPVVISFIVQVPAALVLWRLHLFAFDGSALTLALALAGPLALIAARRFPGPVVAFVTLAACTDLLISPANFSGPYLALAFAIVGAVVRGARLWAWISVATGWVGTLLVAGLIGFPTHPGQIVVTALGILIMMGIGEGIRSRRERFAELSRTIAQRQQNEVQAERVRIARELHDVLAHSLSQINVQAGVGLHLMDAHPDKAKDALASIKETSKSALDEVRSVLGLLRSEEGAPLVPEPDLSRIPGLAASVTTQGVEVSVVGNPENVPKTTQLAMYRIVQESLTNVVRHANATRASVELGEENGMFTVTVTDNGAGSSAGESGRGLLGMRERAELLGGTLTAGPAPSGGFRVAARIPARERAL